MQETEVVYAVEARLDPIYVGGGVDVWIGADEETLWIATASDGIHLREMATGKSRVILQMQMDSDGDETVGVTCFTSAPFRYGRIFVAKDNGVIESWLVPSDYSVPSTMDRSWKVNPGSATTVAKSPITCMLHHPASPLLVTGSADHSIRVWDSLQGYCTHSLKGAHGGIISALAWHPNQEHIELFSASEDGTIARWNLMAGSSSKDSSNLVAVLRGHTSSVKAISISPCGGYLASGGRDGVLCIWDLSNSQGLRGKSKKQQSNLPLHTIPMDEQIEALGWHEDTKIWTAGESGIVRVWQTFVDGPPKLFWSSSKLTNTGHIITHALSYPNGLILATSDLNICTLQDLCKNYQKPLFLVGHLGEVTDLTVGINPREPDCPIIAVASNGPEIRLMSPQTRGHAFETLQGHTEAVLSLAWHQDTLVSGSRDCTVRVWQREADRFSPAQVLEGHADAVTAVAISPSSPLIASASSEGTVKLWKRNPEGSLQTAIWTVKAHEGDINGMIFTPKGSRFLITVSQDRTGRIWKTEDGSRVAELKGHRRGVWCVACSPTEQLLATGSGDGTLRLWAIDGNCLRTLESPSVRATSVLRCAFTPDGQRLIAAMGDGTITVWHVRTGTVLGTFDQHPDRIWSLVVFGDFFLSGDASGHVRLWRDVTVETEKARQQEKDTLMLRLQDLSNMIYRGDIKPALLLALELDQPSRVYALLAGLLQGKSAQEALEMLFGLLRTLDEPKQIARLLSWMRDWNVSFKRSYLVQILLAALLQVWPVERLREAHVEGAIECLSAILQHTERHYSRLDELQIDACLVGLMIANIK